MPEFLQLLPPEAAREHWFAHLPPAALQRERVAAAKALGRVTAAVVRAPHPLPQFRRSSVDGYAVRAADTYGASESLPAYLRLAGEAPMGAEVARPLAAGEAMLIHTGGMLPPGADAVVMLEYTQQAHDDEVEVLRAVAVNENVIEIGEDVAAAAEILPAGWRLRPAEIGGLMALGLTEIDVVRRPRIGILSTGDEVVPPDVQPAPGQVRDINSYTLAALVQAHGGQPQPYPIVPDRLAALEDALRQALEANDAVLITAGSSASTRDMTATVIDRLGPPGVLVHGINTRPGKPTILGVCRGKAVVGLPGNPVSALVNGYMLVVPLLERLQGLKPRPSAHLTACLTVNLPSQAGREDWQPVRLAADGQGGWLADPIFGKSNLIFTLAAADGLLRVPEDATGLAAGQQVDVLLLQ